MSYRRTTNVVALGALCALSLLAACGSDKNSTGPNNNTALVRIVNASSSTSGLNATSGSTSLASGLNFQNTNAATSCMAIPAGNQTLNFTSGTSTSNIGTLSNYDFEAGKAYTVVFFGNNNVQVFPESYTAPGSGNYAVRFINATNNAGNIYVTAPGFSIPSGAVANISNLSGSQQSSVSGYNSLTNKGGTFTSFGTGNNFVRMFGTSDNPSTATPTGSYTISNMSTTGAQTVIFTSANASNNNATAFQVNSCQ
jgi:hypothetical protein